jgi:hypothetical protein
MAGRDSRCKADRWPAGDREIRRRRAAGNGCMRAETYTQPNRAAENQIAAAVTKTVQFPKTTPPP